MSDLSWYALRTLPQREQMVKKYLVYRGHQAFTKLERRFGRWHKGKRTDKEYVAAPGYVFVGLPVVPANDTDVTNPWAFTRTCHLIRSVVSYGGKPAPLHPGGLADFLGYDDFSAPDYMRYFHTSPFEIGDLVKIDTPSFEGFELRVKDIQRGEAIFDLVMFAGQAPTEMRVPVAECYKAA